MSSRGCRNWPRRQQDALQQVILDLDPRPQFLRQELPRDARVQDKQDPRQDLAVIQPLAAGMISPAWHHRQQRLDPSP
jgi:hypothetical protein